MAQRFANRVFLDALSRVMGVSLFGKHFEAMSAASPLPKAGPLPEARPHEPSMEEILASIRRIIADDQALFAGQGGSGLEAAQVAKKLDAGASDLGHPANGQDRAPSPPGPAIAARDEHPPRAVHHPDSAPPLADLVPGAEPPLVSAATDGSVASAFNALVASRFVQDSDKFMALTRELVRPMLKAWLDDHLPAIVERLVRAEIERVARGD